jgi:uncharacterized integral membrane protein
MGVPRPKAPARGREEHEPMSDQPTDPTTRMPLPGSTPDLPSTPSAPPVSASAPPVPPPPAPIAPSTAPPPVAPTPPPPPPPAAWASPRRRDDSGRLGSIVVGLIILGLGLWFFASETLQLEMPDISWRQAWPVILIAIGAWIVLGTVRRRR